MLDPLVESVGGSSAMVVQQVLGVRSRAGAALLEVEQFTPGFLGVDKERRDAEQLLGGEQNGTGWHEHGPLENAARACWMLRGLR